MSQTVFQPSSQATTKQQQRDYITEHLLVDGRTPDSATIERIINAKPKPAPKGDLPVRDFSLMR